jgi:hypothetical protein
MTKAGGYELHPACDAWPEMAPKDLADLADDIAKNGLRDLITLYEGKLLDGRNRVLACEMAGVDIPPEKIETYDGDPWLFSLSKNKHRRHMSTDAIAMVVGAMPRGEGGDQSTGSNEPVLPSIAQVAKAAGIPETAVKSAKVVLKHGTPEEKAEARKKGKLRKTADKVRARVTPPKPRQTAAERLNDPDRIIKTLIDKFADGQWRSLTQMSQKTDMIPVSAIREQLTRLGDAVRERSLNDGVQYIIDGDRDELRARAGFAARETDPVDRDRDAAIETIADLKSKLAAANRALKAEVKDADQRHKGYLDASIAYTKETKALKTAHAQEIEALKAVHAKAIEAKDVEITRLTGELAGAKAALASHRKGAPKGAQAWEAIGISRDAWNKRRERDPDEAWAIYADALVKTGKTQDEVIRLVEAAKAETEKKSALAKAAKRNGNGGE